MSYKVRSTASLDVIVLKSECDDTTISFFFFNDPPTTEIYTLSLHDALPISIERFHRQCRAFRFRFAEGCNCLVQPESGKDRKSTRLNSSHGYISYAVFCLKKKKKKRIITIVKKKYKIALKSSTTTLPCFTA